MSAHRAPKPAASHRALRDTWRVGAAFATGFSAGFLVAMQVGPISLLCIRSVLRHGIAVGVAIGGGAALIDATYAGIGAAGGAQLLSIDALRIAFGLIGACVLIALGARTWRRAHAGIGGGDTLASPMRAFTTSLVATASNPLTIASWAAVFLAASPVDDAGASEIVAFLIAIACGTFTWFFILSSIVGRMPARATLVATIDRIAAAGIIVFGVALAVRTVLA